MIPFDKNKLEVGDTVVTDLDEHCIVTEIYEDYYVTKNIKHIPTVGNVLYIIKKK